MPSSNTVPLSRPSSMASWRAQVTRELGIRENPKLLHGPRGISTSRRSASGGHSERVPSPIFNRTVPELSGFHTGQPVRQWRWQRWNGCRGSTTTDYSNPSDTSHLPKLRQTTIGNSPVRSPWWRHDLNQTTSTKPGALQCSWGVGIFRDYQIRWTALCNKAGPHHPKPH